jgi:hypothetical protein
VLLAASHGQPSLRKMYNKKIECYDMMLMLWLSGRRMADEVIQYRNKNTFSIFSNFSRKRRMAHALIGWSVTAAASRSQSAKKHVKARNEMRGGGQGEEAVKSVSSECAALPLARCTACLLLAELLEPFARLDQLLFPSLFHKHLTTQNGSLCRCNHRGRYHWKPHVLPGAINGAVLS